MEVTETTLLALLLCSILAISGPERGLWALMVSLPFGVAAAVNLPALGNSSILVADCVALTFVVLVLGRFLASGDSQALRLPATAGWIIALLAFGAFITIVGPRLFANQIEVFTIGRTALEETVVRTTLQPSSKNISQLLQFSISLLVGLAMLMSTPHRIEQALPGAVMAMTATHFALALADVVTFWLGQPTLLDFIRNANYSVLFGHQIEGVKRVIGGFAEASAFGNFSLAIFGFWLLYWLKGGARRQAGPLALMAFLVVLSSGSSAAFVAIVAFLILVLALSLFQPDHPKLRRNRNALMLFALAILPMAAVGVWILAETNPAFGGYFDRLLFSKLESASGVERTMWNRAAFQTFLESHLIGVGLGSVRSSNFLIASLSTLGLLGTFLLVGLLINVAAQRMRGDVSSERVILVHAARGACLALMCKALITKSSPDLEVIFFVFAGLAVLLAHPNPRRRQLQPAGQVMRSIPAHLAGGPRSLGESNR